MPIYMKVEGVKGDVQAGGATGGVWKTTNFITSGHPGGGPHVKVFSGSTGSNLQEVSRISLSTGTSSVEAFDPAARFKIEQMVNIARSYRTPIKVFLCPSDTRAANHEAQGRLVLGTEQGVWRSAATRRKPHIPNNIKQMPLPALNSATVEIIVTDASGTVLDTHRFERSTVSRHSGGVNVLMGDGSVRF